MSDFVQILYIGVLNRKFNCCIAMVDPSGDCRIPVDISVCWNSNEVCLMASTAMYVLSFHIFCFSLKYYYSFQDDAPNVQNKDPFNLSNDKYYNPKMMDNALKSNIGGSLIQVRNVFFFNYQKSDRTVVFKMTYQSCVGLRRKGSNSRL